MRKLAIDVGNTRTKLALWENGMRKEWDGEPVEMAMASVTGRTPDWQQELPGVEVRLLAADTKLPIALDYSTPETLGADRKAAACGAWALNSERKDCVIIDAGTCVTIDLLSREGVFEGGAILPGVKMKFEALHTFTAKLPLIKDSLTDSLPQGGITGKSTLESMTAGVITATRMEIEGFVDRYREKLGQVEVIMTGGDAELLAPKGARIEKDLVLIGINEIMNLR